LQKLATTPLSAFYSKAHKDLAGNRIRFCFFKVYLHLPQYIRLHCLEQW